MKDFLRLYSSLVQRCFDDCANDFTTKSITGKEVKEKKRYGFDLIGMNAYMDTNNMAVVIVCLGSMCEQGR